MADKKELTGVTEQTITQINISISQVAQTIAQLGSHIDKQFEATSKQISQIQKTIDTVTHTTNDNASAISGLSSTVSHINTKVTEEKSRAQRHYDRIYPLFEQLEKRVEVNEIKHSNIDTRFSAQDAVAKKQANRMRLIFTAVGVAIALFTYIQKERFNDIEHIRIGSYGEHRTEKE